MASLKVRIWHLPKGTLQWYVLWLAHNKFMVGVCGVILNERNQVLLLRHRYWQKGSWGLPGGHANSGETLEEALAREVKEETGYVVDVTSLLRVVSGYRLRVEVSYMGWIARGEAKLPPEEVLEARFFAVSELPDGLLDIHRKLVTLAFE